jgi:hypothetical protein
MGVAGGTKDRQVLLPTHSPPMYGAPLTLCGQAAIVSFLCFASGATIPLLAASFITDAIIRLISIILATTFGLTIFGVSGGQTGRLAGRLVADALIAFCALFSWKTPWKMHQWLNCSLCPLFLSPLKCRCVPRWSKYMGRRHESVHRGLAGTGNIVWHWIRVSCSGVWLSSWYIDVMSLHADANDFLP